MPNAINSLRGRRVFACHGRKLQLTNEWMPDNSAFVIGSIIGNRPLTTRARQFAELTNCHNELRAWLFCSWPAIAARANSPDVCSKRVHRQTLAGGILRGRGGVEKREREREGERIFQRRSDRSDPSPYWKTKWPQLGVFRVVSRGIGRAQDPRRLWRWLPVIEWNNCFHLFESRMERRVVDGGLVVWLVKGTYFGFVLMDVSVSLTFRQLKMVMQRSNNADRAEIFKNRSYFNRITLIFYYSKYWIVDLR